MNEQQFGVLFGPYMPPDGQWKALEDGTVLQLDIHHSTRMVGVTLRLESLVSAEVLFAAEKEIAAAMHMSVATIAPRFPGELLGEEAWPSLVEHLRRRNVAVNGTFDDARFTLTEETLTVYCTHGGVNILRATDTERLLQELIGEQFGRRVKVTFEGEEVPCEDEHYREMQRRAEEEAAQAARIQAEKRAAELAAQPQPASATAPAKPGKPSDPTRPPADGLPVYLDTAQVLFGTPVRERPVPIKGLEADGSTVTVWGEIFRIDSRDNRDGTKTNYSISITDRTSSLTLKLWLTKGRDNDRIAAVEGLKNGACLVVTGPYDYDDYAKCNLLRPKSMSVVAKYTRQDLAEQKRVELHMHTKMSAMDAVTDAATLIKRAASWGHKAVAITDHGVVQAFPDIMNAAKDLKKAGTPIKVLYGMEAYYVNDMIPAVEGREDTPLTGACIVFDIETTGLSSTADRITEIGAVRVVNGEIEEEFDIFVNPGKPIPPKITELTGITDAMVADAPDEGEALEQFYAFCGDCRVLVAHNAKFDTSFIRAAARRTGKEYPFTSIDTVPVCRALYPGHKNYKLDTVAEFLRLPPFNHHRACDDARVLAQIFGHCIRDMADREITTVQQINCSITGVDPKKAGYYHMILIARNQVGLKNLYKLVSYSNLECFARKPRIPRSKLMEHREGLIIGSACEAG